MKQVVQNYVVSVLMAAAYVVIVILLSGLLLGVAIHKFGAWHGTGVQATLKSDVVFLAEIVVGVFCLIEGIRQICAWRYQPRTIKHLIASVFLVSVGITLCVFMVGSIWPDLRWVF